MNFLFRRQSLHLNTFIVSTLFSCSLLASEQKVQLKVAFEKVQPQRGQIYCNLFASSKGFPGNAEQAIQSVAVVVEQSQVICDFGQVKPGVYAIAAMHDENDNGKMDTNLIGIPKEGWAVSNNAGPGLFGPPSFKASSFELGAVDKTKIQLEFRY